MASFNKLILVGNLTRDPELRYTPKGSKRLPRNGGTVEQTDRIMKRPAQGRFTTLKPEDCRDSNDQYILDLWLYIKHLEDQITPSLTLSAELPKPKNKAVGTLDECVSYAVSRSLPVADGEWFFDRMETVGWQLGKAKVKDWQACIRTWQREGYLPSLRQGYSGTMKVTAQWVPPTGI